MKVAVREGSYWTGWTFIFSIVFILLWLFISRSVPRFRLNRYRSLGWHHRDFIGSHNLHPIFLITRADSHISHSKICGICPLICGENSKIWVTLVHYILYEPVESIPCFSWRRILSLSFHWLQSLKISNRWCRLYPPSSSVNRIVWISFQLISASIFMKLW